MRELLGEYIARVLRLLQEPRVASLEETQELQQVLRKLNQTLKIECIADGDETGREDTTPDEL